MMQFSNQLIFVNFMEYKMNNQMELFVKEVQSEKFSGQLLNYVMDEKLVNKVKQMVITEIRKKPNLLKCQPESIIGAVLECVQLGLSLDSNLGHAALIPFNQNIGTSKHPQWVTKCQLMPMYRGYIHLGFNTGQIISVDSYVKKSNDTSFSYKIVDGVVLLSHEPALSNRGELEGAYVVINFKNGAKKIVFMDKDEILACKNSSKQKTVDDKGNPIETVWDKFPEEMWKKTVIRRAFKQVDLSPQLSAAVTMDELCEAGVDQNNGALLDVSDFSHIEQPKATKLAEPLLEPKETKATEAEVKEWVADFDAQAKKEEEDTKTDTLKNALRAEFAKAEWTPENVKIRLKSKYGVETVQELSREQTIELIGIVSKYISDKLKRKAA